MQNKTLDQSKPIQTRAGRPARIVAVLKGDRTFPILAIVTQEDGSETYDTFKLNGAVGSNGTSPNDLVNVPEEQVSYVGLEVGKHGVNGASSTRGQIGTLGINNFTSAFDAVFKVITVNGKVKSVEIVKGLDSFDF